MPARTPEEIDVLFQKFLNAGDVDGLVGLYEPNATLIGGPDQPANGTAAIREALTAFVDTQAKIDLRVEQTVIAGDDIATLYSTWTLSGGPEEMGGKSVEVVRRQADGAWLFVFDDPWGRGS